MTTYKTIRKNSKKKIASILNNAALISEYKYDDMCGDTANTITPEYVLSKIAECYDMVSIYSSENDAGEVDYVRVRFHQNWTISIYPSKDKAKENLTPEAYARYFSEAPTSNPVREQIKARPVEDRKQKPSNVVCFATFKRLKAC